MSRTRQVPSNTASSSHIQLLSPAVRQENHSCVRISGTLRLRAENDSIATDQIEDPTPGRHIRWTEDVVDNEGMGKKSSKGKRIWYIEAVSTICLLSLSLLLLFPVYFQVCFRHHLHRLPCDSDWTLITMMSGRL